MLAAVLMATPAFAAEPSAADKAKAHTLLDEGDAAFQKGEYQQALEKYRAADALVGGVPTTGIAVARAQEKLGLWVEATVTTADVQRYPTTPWEPAPVKEARAEAAKLAAELEERIPTLTITVPGAADATVTIDGVALAPDVRFLPRRLNPGKHEVVIETPGRREKLDIDLHERDRPKLEVAGTSCPALPPGPVCPAPPPPLKAAPPSGKGQRVAGIIVTGLGVTGLVAFGVTGGAFLAKKAIAQDHCTADKLCDPEGLDAVAAGRTLGIANAVALGLGVAGLGVGIALVATTPKGPPAPHAAVRVTPLGTVVLEGAF